MEGEKTGRHDEAKEFRYILCVQETKWKESKARNVGGGCELFYNGADGRRNGIGIGIAIREELVKSVLEVKRVSERIMVIKL